MNRINCNGARFESHWLEALQSFSQRIIFCRKTGPERHGRLTVTKSCFSQSHVAITSSRQFKNRSLVTLKFSLEQSFRRTHNGTSCSTAGLTEKRAKAKAEEAKAKHREKYGGI